MKFIFFFFLSLLVVFYANAQNVTIEELKKMGDEELLDYFNQVNYDSILAAPVAQLYLNRGRFRKDTIMMARGYDRLARIFSVDTNLKYADSIIELTKNVDNITYPGLGYIIKANLFTEKDDLAPSFDNYKIAYEVAQKKNNQSQLAYINSSLVFLKILWGDRNEGLKIQQERYKLIFKKNYRENFKLSTRQSAYDRIDEFINADKISSLALLSLCYLYNSQLDSSYVFAKKSQNLNEDTRPYSYKSNINFVDEILMELFFAKKEYNQSILYGNKIINNIGDNIGDSKLMNIYFYRGMAMYDNGFIDNGILFLQKADSISNTKIDLEYQPNDRELFLRLKQYYATQNNLIKENEYLGKLIKIDSLIKVNYKIVEPTILSEFETPKLLEAKNSEIITLSKKNKISRTTQIWLGIILVIAFILCGIFYKMQMKYKKRYTMLVNGNLKNNHSGVVDIKTKQEPGAISTALIDEILEKLERFERKKEYLNTQLSLQYLSKKLHTNPNYLSRVINLKMEKNFSQYINDLRIDFAVNELKENEIFRKYAIKAVAEECGFNTANSFSRAFYNRTGLYPSYFINKLRKDKAG